MAGWLSIPNAVSRIFHQPAQQHTAGWVGGHTGSAQNAVPGCCRAPARPCPPTRTPLRTAPVADDAGEGHGRRQVGPDVKGPIQQGGLDGLRWAACVRVGGWVGQAERGGATAAQHGSTSMRETKRCSPLTVSPGTAEGEPTPPAHTRTLLSPTPHTPPPPSAAHLRHGLVDHLLGLRQRRHHLRLHRHLHRRRQRAAAAFLPRRPHSSSKLCFQRLVHRRRQRTAAASLLPRPHRSKLCFQRLEHRRGQRTAAATAALLPCPAHGKLCLQRLVHRCIDCLKLQLNSFMHSLIDGIVHSLINGFVHSLIDLRVEQRRAMVPVARLADAGCCGGGGGGGFSCCMLWGQPMVHDIAVKVAAGNSAVAATAAAAAVAAAGAAHSRGARRWQLRRRWQLLRRRQQ